MKYIVHLYGGLGNQLFEYAAARSLAQKYEVPLKVDISPFNHYKLHQYSLFHFSITAGLATPAEIAETLNIYHEPSFRFEPAFRNIIPDAYLCGYRQSEKYFIDIEDIIRKEFIIKAPPRGLNKDLANKIQSCKAISIHVRRGDYISDTYTNKYHGTCDLNYYYQAVETIAAAVSNPHFFIFSDDPQWTMQNLVLPYQTTFISHNNADKNFEDLRLMSLCKHNIIANSSFSWWAAWLNQNPDKMIIAPKKWFGEVEIDTTDLIPKDWKKI